MTFSRLAHRSLLLTVVGVLLAAPAWAQSKITWSIDRPYGVKEVWSMNPDGTGKENLIQNGLSAPAPYESIGQIAGPSVMTYPLNPADSNAPRVRWFLTTLQSQSLPRIDLFAFAPDGQGGVVWRQLSELPWEPEPGKWEHLTGGVVLPTSPDDSFASMTISRVYFDGPTFWDSTVWTETNELVRLDNPFERAERSVTLADLESAIAERPLEREIGQHSWSPDGGSVAYLGRQYASDGSYRRALWVYDLTAGTDLFLLDSRSSGLSPSDPRWSPGGQEIAFGWSSSFSTDSPGTYAVNPSSGALRVIATRGTTSYYYNQPVWSPDGSLMAAVQHYTGMGSNLRNRYAIGRFPASGVTKKNQPVLLTPTSPPYQYHRILNWR